MMEQKHWLLPEGISETLPPQANELEHLRRTLLDLYRSWGYELVFPRLWSIWIPCLPAPVAI